MSTKAVVNFTDADGEVVAAIYLHNGGHDVAAELGTFFDAVLETVGDGLTATRFHDPSYLAARYVAWKAGGAGAGASGVGVIVPGRWYAHRVFTVRCRREPSLLPPAVTAA